MPKSENQKLKLLYLIDILQTETDEEHPMPIKEIISRLAEKGVKAERKALYDDFAVLNDFGIDVELCNAGYYIGQREYELAELKTLVDIVQSARFLTPKKSNRLIQKFYRQTSKYGAAELNRQIHTSRVKMPNEKIFYAVDSIHSAIRDNRQISFSYYKYDISKRLVERHKDLRYVESPWTLIWDDENYYLLAYSEADDRIRHFRVDRIGDVKVLDAKRLGAKTYKNTDIGVYESKTFGMFGGNDEMVTLNCSEEAAGAIIDRFGSKPSFIVQEDGSFNVTVHIFTSPQFYGWVCGMNGLVRIAGPKSVCNGFKEYLQRLLIDYDK